MNGIWDSCLSSTSFEIIGILLENLASHPYMAEHVELSAHLSQESLCYPLTHQTYDRQCLWWVHLSFYRKSHESCELWLSVYTVYASFPICSNQRLGSWVEPWIRMLQIRVLSPVDTHPAWVNVGFLITECLESQEVSTPPSEDCCLFEGAHVHPWPLCPSPMPHRSPLGDIFSRKYTLCFTPLCHIQCFKVDLTQNV